MNNGIFQSIFTVLLAFIILIAVYQIVGFIRGCFFRKEEFSRCISWFSAIRKNESSLQCAAAFISNGLYSKDNRSFRKYLQLQVFVKTLQATEIARSLGMEVKPKAPSYCCSFVLKKHMTGLERMLLLYRIYDYIEDNYQQDKVEFHPFRKCIDIFFRHS